MTQRLYEASTIYGVASLIAMLGDEAPSGERILLLCANTADPEVNNPLRDFCSSSRLVRSVFDRVIDLNEAIWPLIPTHWRAPGDQTERVAYATLFRKGLGLEEVEEIHLESIATQPSKTLAELFRKARIHVYADGLMTYSPTRFPVGPRTAGRIESLSYVDLYPGLKPLLLAEFGVKTAPIPLAGLRKTFETIAAERGAGEKPVSLEGCVVFVGQYLSAIRLMSEDEEAALYADGVVRAARRYPGARILFKAHPSAGPDLFRKVRDAARKRKVDLEALPHERLLEELLVVSPPRAVAGLFSTALFTAKRVFGVEAFSTANPRLFEGLEPYANSNRIPILLSLIELNPDHGRVDAGPLVDLVGAAMQPEYALDRLETLIAAPAEGAVDPFGVRAGAIERIRAFQEAQGEKETARLKAARAERKKTEWHFSRGGISVAWERQSRLSKLRDFLLVWSSGYFDRSWYLQRYPGAKRTGRHPVLHFLQNGCANGADPGRKFGAREYYADNPDVLRSGANALVHYLRFGRKEGRRARGAPKLKGAARSG